MIGRNIAGLYGGECGIAGEAVTAEVGGLDAKTEPEADLLKPSPARVRERRIRARFDVGRSLHEADDALPVGPNADGDRPRRAGHARGAR
jgi:hypothetical protein